MLIIDNAAGAAVSGDSAFLRTMPSLATRSDTPRDCDAVLGMVMTFCADVDCKSWENASLIAPASLVTKPDIPVCWSVVLRTVAVLCTGDVSERDVATILDAV